ncbi:hypothetical protein [Providencia rettgeri]|uniref:Uncharacterized protein n=1 Tax=Providencia rettgeri TaxID=587 RepID=A0AAE2ZC26_PRORE|nr:hypothetical protein [Providencia rettgeri]MBW3117109.1 hypothetical protein [Providencia rettgeri]NHN52504.1 hypothetical protein [Providencia rettgeri]
MEKLQQLASTIAQIYVDGLKAETGTTLVTYNGITGEVIPELLAAGLFDNAVSIVKSRGESFDVESKACDLLLPYLNVFTKPYSITERCICDIGKMVGFALRDGDIRELSTTH